MTTIDSFVQENNIKQLDFISLQINGAKPLALNGALETLTPLGYECLIEDKEEVIYIHHQQYN